MRIQTKACQVLTSKEGLLNNHLFP